MNLYAYCLCREIDSNVLETVTGLGGQRPFVVTYDEIVAIVSRVPDIPITVTRENVLAHEKVISRVFTRDTPLPFRFGGLLRSGELDRYVSSNKLSLLSMLDRVRGAAEMSIKIIHQARSNGDEGQRIEEPAVIPPDIGRGASFLAAKRREMAESRISEERAREIGDWLSAGLSEVAKDSFLRLRPTEGLAVKASHLVERSRLDEYRERVKDLREGRPELLFLTSGPWPPYSFCDLTTSA